MNLEKALCRVEWSSGMRLETFVHATEPVGWFRFENAGTDFVPELVAPRYQGTIAEGGTVNSLVGDDLARLDYEQGVIIKNKNSIVYRQEGYGGFRYEIAVEWKKIKRGTFEGDVEYFISLSRQARSFGGRGTKSE